MLEGIGAGRIAVRPALTGDARFSQSQREKNVCGRGSIYGRANAVYESIENETSRMTTFPSRQPTASVLPSALHASVVGSKPVA